MTCQCWSAELPPLSDNLKNRKLNSTSLQPSFIMSMLRSKARRLLRGMPRFLIEFIYMASAVARTSTKFSSINPIYKSISYRARFGPGFNHILSFEIIDCSSIVLACPVAPSTNWYYGTIHAKRNLGNHRRRTCHDQIYLKHLSLREAMALDIKKRRYHRTSTSLSGFSRSVRSSPHQTTTLP